MKTGPGQWFLVLFAAAFFALLTVGGCVSPTADNNELPWNTPPPWEGVPTIPGLSTP